MLAGADFLSAFASALASAFESLAETAAAGAVSDAFAGFAFAVSAFSLAAVYQPKGDQYAELEVVTSPVDAPREVRAREAEKALSWFKTITADCFG